MFASLKSKIKEETGDEVTAQRRVSQQNNNRMRSRLSSTISMNSASDETGKAGMGDHVRDSLSIFNEEKMSKLRAQCMDLNDKVVELNARLCTLQEEKQRVDKTNEILLETVKVAQTQKDIYCEEQELIQNKQQTEIEQLKSLLSFREQEAIDRLSVIGQHEQTIINLTTHVERLASYEELVDSLQDELESLRHSSAQSKKTYTTSLAAIKEENGHLQTRLQIMNSARMDALVSLGREEKIQALATERKLLEQHLEEAHLQLTDIKSTWCGQNLALETQVSRLSQQVAEESSEKRKTLTERDEANEKVKQLQFQLQLQTSEMEQRDVKIRLLQEQIDEVNTALKKCREENEQQILFERNKAETLQTEANDLRTRLNTANERFGDYASHAEQVARTLRQKNVEQQTQLDELNTQLDILRAQFDEALANLETEKEEKLTSLLRNAEISQNFERLQQELRIECDEHKELQTRYESELREKTEREKAANELRTVLKRNDTKLLEIDEMRKEIIGKNQTIKVLTKRLNELKKTIKDKTSAMLPSASSKSLPSATERAFANGLAGGKLGVSLTNGQVVMDEVNFKYLKHVIVKFLTSREVEARHLIRAVATLLQLTKDEEQMLHETLNWKTSWFGTRPERGNLQRFHNHPSTDPTS